MGSEKPSTKSCKLFPAIFPHYFEENKLYAREGHLAVIMIMKNKCLALLVLGRNPVTHLKGCTIEISLEISQNI